MIWYMDGDCELFYCNWVLLSVGFCLQGKCGMVRCCACVVEWAVVPSQFDGLADGTECGLDATSFDLVATSKFALPYLLSENMQDQQSFCWSQIVKVRIDVGGKKVDPVPPVMLPCCESRRHNSRLDVSVNSVERTCPVVAFGRQQQIQELFCGSGKWW